MRPPRTVALVAIALTVAAAVGGCAGGDDESDTTPLTLEQRLLPAEDADGFASEETFEWGDEEEAVSQGLGPGLPRQNDDEAVDVLTRAGFVEGVAELLTKGDQENLIVMVLRFDSPEGAKDAGDWIHQQDLKPCLKTCSVDFSELDVDEIPGSWAARRLVEEDRTGPTDVLPPWDRYLIDFADGAFLYLVERASPYATSSEGDEDDARDAAKALYDRVKGAPAPSG